MRNNFTYIVFFTLICFKSLDVYGQYGSGAWSNKTPYGNTIYENYLYEKKLIVQQKDTIENLKSWYFYEGYIIGKTKYEYFIVSEKNEEKIFFNSKQQWCEKIISKDLEPKYIKREFKSRFRFSLMGFLGMLVYGAMITVPLIIWLLFSTYQAFKKVAMPFLKGIVIIQWIIVLGYIASMFIVESW